MSLLFYGNLTVVHLSHHCMPQLSEASWRNYGSREVKGYLKDPELDNLEHFFDILQGRKMNRDKVDGVVRKLVEE